MHVVIFNIIYLNGAKSPKSDMKRNICYLNARILYLIKQAFGEVKTCCRRRCASFVLCIYCLISVLVGKLLGYIWRKRHLTELIKYLFKYPVKFKRNYPVSVRQYAFDLAYKIIVTEDHSGSRSKLLSGTYKGFPFTVTPPFQQKHFDRRSCIFFGPEEPSGDNLRIIKNKAVSLFKVFLYILEYLMFYNARFLIHYEKPG